MTSLSKSRTQEINQLHEGIASSLRRSVEDAIKIGGLLSEEKEGKTYEDFVGWVKADLSFGEHTARRYMQVFSYRDKTATLADLSQAYKHVEQLEAEKKRDREERLDRLIEEKKTEKPRSFPKTPDRRAASYREKKKDKPEPKLFTEPEKPKDRTPFEKLVDAVLNEPPAKNEDLALADMRDNIRQGNVFTVLKEYIESFDGVSRQLEATYNLMRYLKRVAIELQPKTQS